MYSSNCGEMAPDTIMTTKSLYGQHVVMNVKSKGFSSSIINSARSALSVCITLEIIEAGKRPLICQYMK